MSKNLDKAQKIALCALILVSPILMIRSLKSPLSKILQTLVDADMIKLPAYFFRPVLRLELQLVVMFLLQSLCGTSR